MGAYEVLVDFVLWQIADEAAVDLQVVDGEVLQFVEGRIADAEIIERQVAADMPKRVSEDLGAIGVRDGGRFGDLEGQMRRVDVILFELLFDQSRELEIS